jgi:hypothetical protein
MPAIIIKKGGSMEGYLSIGRERQIEETPSTNNSKEV